jgi:cell division protein FtsW
MTTTARPPARARTGRKPRSADAATTAPRPPARNGQRPRQRRPQGTARQAPYLVLVLVVAALNLIGLVMVLSASSVQALRNHGSSWFFFNRQLVWVAIGTVVLVITSRIDYRRLQRIAVPLLGVSLTLMVAVLVPGVGISVAGSTRWLGYGALRLQPSELAKLALLLYACDLLARRGDRMDDRKATLWPVVGMYVAVAVLLLAQPDLGTALVTGGIVLSVLFLAGAPLGSMAGLGVAAAFMTVLLAKVEPYRWRRITSFLDPLADATSTGYQAAQGRVALASGGLFGVGLGASRAKWGFLPAAHTDFIFAIIGEELGLAGTLVVVVLFAGLAALGVRAAVRAPDRFGGLLAGGVTAWIVGQAVINVGAVVGLLPITGVPLPFVSSGGSSLVPAMAAVGLLLNVTRQSPPPAKARRPGG